MLRGSSRSFAFQDANQGAADDQQAWVLQTYSLNMCKSQQTAQSMSRAAAAAPAAALLLLSAILAVRRLT
jgi:hypothetical protein